MVKINRVYTRTGDDGSTGLVGGDRVLKDSARVEAYGEVDELNAQLGVARTEADRVQSKRILEMLAIIQNELFDLGAELATLPGREWPTMSHASAEQSTRMERWIDELTAGLPELKSFVLPGGTALNGALHVARAVCRRAERRVLSMSRAESVNPEALKYLNRLSDLLFAMARSESARAGAPEYLWQPGKPSAA